MAKISVVINTLNEEQNIERALKSVKNLADEIVVVDMHSDDQTVKIARRLGAKIFSHERTNYVEPARNFAITKTTGDWILILDADEEVPKDLVKKLKDLSQDGQSSYFRLPRKNIIFGKWIKNSRWWPDYNVRFFKKGTVIWSDEIHSLPITTGIGQDIEATEELALTHHNYQTVEQFVDRLNRYTTIQAIRLNDNKYTFTWKDVLRRSSSEFLGRYFAGEGYKDGIHGVALASLQAFSELVVYLKVWQLQKFKEEKVSIRDMAHEMKLNEKETNYWLADTEVKNGGGVKYRIRRKFKLP